MRERFFRAVLRHRKAVVALFAAATVVCALLKPLVSVDYDMNDYLPGEVASSEALDVMAEQFSGDIPNARVMVEVSGIPEALAYKERLEQAAGVEEVLWLDDVADLTVPLAMQDADTVETYYKDGCALFSVTLAEGRYVEGVRGIRDVVGDEAALDGSAVSTATATSSTTSQIQMITAVAIVVILIVLLLTTSSWLEPLVIMAGLGVAVIINGGSNLMLGEISFVTDAAGTILQVGISLDFAVFFIHRYAELRGSRPAAQDDIALALCKSSTAIFTSGLTVTIGFLALTAMRFQIGPDLGFALAKGIVISLVTVFTFVPSLLCMCAGAVERARHDETFSDLTGLSRAVRYAMVPLAVVFCLLPVPAYLASTSSQIEYWYGASHIFGAGTQAGDDATRIEEVFGQGDTYVLMVPAGDRVREKALSDALHGVSQVTGIVSYVDSAGVRVPSGMVDESTLSQIEGDAYTRMVLSVAAPQEGQETFDLVETVRELAQEYYPDEWYLAGAGVSTTDLMQTIVEDKDKVDLIAVAAVLIVLLFATRSLSLPFILVMVIETTIWVNFSMPYFSGSAEFYISYLICSTIQLGVTVDYAILFSDRYKEERRRLPKTQAVRATVQATTVPILTSGTVLAACGLLLGLISTHGILAQLGTFLCTGVLMSLFVVLFVLPGFLWLLDWLVGKTTLHAGFISNKVKAIEAEGGRADDGE